jgi:hypothetical protein
MLTDFDLAVLAKIKAYYPNTIYANTAIVYNVAYSLVNEPTVKLSFPMINIYRPSGFELAESQNFAAKMRGIPFNYLEASDMVDLARYLTVNLHYQLDIYAKTPEELSNITMEIMQALNLDPHVTVVQTDTKNNVAYSEKYQLSYNNGPVEQSEFNNDDRIYRYAVAYEIKNARVVNFKLTPAVTEIESTLKVDGKEV